MEDELLKAWAAGFFDGEGCISLGNSYVTRRRRKYIRFAVIVAQNNPAPLLLMMDKWGGNMCVVGRSTRWSVSGDRAGVSLRDILPYLVVKKKEAELAVSYLENCRQPMGTNVTPPELRKLRQDYIARMSELKREF